MKPITKEYIRKFSILILITIFAWMFNDSSMKDYFYTFLLLSILIYIFGPKVKIDADAVGYSTILVLDVVGFVSWTGAMLLVFFVMVNGRDSITGAMTFFLIFALLPLILVWYSVKLSSRCA